MNPTITTAIDIILSTLPEECHRIYRIFCSSQYINCNLWEFTVEADGTIFDGSLPDGTVLCSPNWDPRILECLKTIQGLYCMSNED